MTNEIAGDSRHLENLQDLVQKIKVVGVLSVLFQDNSNTPNKEQISPKNRNNDLN